MVSIAVEYGYKHLGASILASDLDAVKNSIRRRFHTTIAMASWRGYANMLLGRIQYVGKAYAFNKVQRQYRLVEHLDQGAFGSWSCAHLMDRPLPVPRRRHQCPSSTILRSCYGLPKPYTSWKRVVDFVCS